MARNVEIQVNDSGSPVARMDGRGDLVGTVVPTPTGFRLRLDDESRPEFWAEVGFDLNVLLRRLDEVRAQEAAQHFCKNCGDGVHPGDDYCGMCSPVCDIDDHEPL